MWTVPSTVYVDHIPNKKSILIADETNWPLIQWINKGRMVNYSIYIYIYIYIAFDFNVSSLLGPIAMQQSMQKHNKSLWNRIC